MVTYPAVIQCSLSGYWWCGRLFISASLEPDRGADSAVCLLLQTTSINEGVSMYSWLQELIITCPWYPFKIAVMLILEVNVSHYMRMLGHYATLLFMSSSIGIYCSELIQTQPASTSHYPCLNHWNEGNYWTRLHVMWCSYIHWYFLIIIDL